MQGLRHDRSGIGQTGGTLRYSATVKTRLSSLTTTRVHSSCCSTARASQSNLSFTRLVDAAVTTVRSSQSFQSPGLAPHRASLTCTLLRPTKTLCGLLESL